MKYLYMLFILLSMTSIFFTPADKHELNELSFSFAIGLDYLKDGYEVSLQLINPAAISGNAPTQNSRYIVYKASGKTIDTALERISVNISRFVLLSQVDVVILSEKLAREGKIQEIADYILNSPQIPSNAYIVITRGVNASELLKVYSPVEGTSAFEITNIIKKIGRDIPKTSSQLKVDEIKEGKDIALPFIELVGDLEQGQENGNFETTSPSHTAYGGLALFKDDKLTAFIDYRDGGYLSLLQESASGFTIEAGCPKEEDDYFAYRVFSNNTKESNIEIQGEKYIFHFDLRLKGDINQYHCNLNLDDPRDVEKLEEKVKETINIEVQELLKVAQENELDPIGLGLILSEDNPKEWKKIKDEWPSLLKNAEIKLNTKISFQHLGNYKSGRE
ncbi:Ger(x)C family spore germination protein [Sutcliffiella horikoshii]|uniref:Ger(x)C family spore germination protein n=1 Tax=Sutcliffiella horikoshii TaxID=79883 RepID=UPI001EEDAF4D|nr:Ger(x)C family spore germination protein [Sutcliffiella horikoshii]MCG1022745.1 Ger(x)C family spore germination protein [Sutcliffiella horikoshii]